MASYNEIETQISEMECGTKELVAKWDISLNNILKLNSYEHYYRVEAGNLYWIVEKCECREG